MMYKITRMTATLENGDRINKKPDITVKDEKEIEAFREEMKAEHKAKRICLSYGEMEESETIKNP
jgi:hypothetical protein